MRPPSKNRPTQRLPTGIGTEQDRPALAEEVHLGDRSEPRMVVRHELEWIADVGEAAAEEGNSSTSWNRTTANSDRHACQIDMV
jgi:hypothetical protein